MSKRKQDEMDIEEDLPEETPPPPVVRRERTKEEIRESLPWVEKYRPTQLEELVSQESIISTLTKLIESNKLPHLLFYGPPGTGKTSTILACARKVNGPNFQNLILELNASDDRRIDNVREEIKDFASTKKIVEKGIKMVILDEADAMTQEAQAALRRVIEKFSSNTRFCLICNHVNKIAPAIQSRCTKFRFGPLSGDQIRNRLEDIIRTEGVNATEDGIKALINLASGDMRKVLNVLQATHMAHGMVNEHNVYLCTGNPLPKDIDKISIWLFNLEFKEAFYKIQELSTKKGLALQDILHDVHFKLLHTKLHDEVYIDLYKALAEVEYSLTVGSNEKLQLGAMVAAFQLAKKAIAS